MIWLVSVRLSSGRWRPAALAEDRQTALAVVAAMEDDAPGLAIRVDRRRWCRWAEVAT